MSADTVGEYRTACKSMDDRVRDLSLYIINNMDLDKPSTRHTLDVLRGVRTTLGEVLY